MASSRGTSNNLKLQALPNKYNHRETSPERTKVWTEPCPKLNLHGNGGRRPHTVPVVYYLSRNGQLEHPHFMEVPLPSSQGLFLKDVINRLNLLRGKGMANHYSWSAKRSYKNGYVWRDLEESDLIHPVHGHEYVLKGSEIPETSVSSITTKSSETASSELSREEISPPPSDSSTETLESLMKADGKLALSTVDMDPHRTAGKVKTSSVLMSLISCGSISFRNCGAAVVKDHGLSLVSHFKGRLPRGENQTVEDKEQIKRSSSYNADR